MCWQTSAQPVQQLFSFFLPNDILAHNRHKLFQDFDGGHASMWSSYDIGMLIDLITRICWLLQVSSIDVNTLRNLKAPKAVS